MRYSIIWESECFEHLEAFLRAGARWEDLLRAAKSIDDELCVEPGQRGGDVAEGLRKIDFPPQRAFYHVEESALHVKIDGLWWIGGNRPSDFSG